MKSGKIGQKQYILQSLPTRGEWIEIQHLIVSDCFAVSLFPHGESGLKLRGDDMGIDITGSLPTRGEWIEMFLLMMGTSSKPSLPTQGEWIEIHLVKQ